MFCELVGLTSKTVEETMEMVTIMNAAFSCFDAIMDRFSAYKVSFPKNYLIRDVLTL